MQPTSRHAKGDAFKNTLRDVFGTLDYGSPQASPREESAESQASPRSRARQLTTPYAVMDARYDVRPIPSIPARCKARWRNGASLWAATIEKLKFDISTRVEDAERLVNYLESDSPEPPFAQLFDMPLGDLLKLFMIPAIRVEVRYESDESRATNIPLADIELPQQRPRKKGEPEVEPKVVAIASREMIDDLRERQMLEEKLKGGTTPPPASDDGKNPDDVADLRRRKLERRGSDLPETKPSANDSALSKLLNAASSSDDEDDDIAVTPIAKAVVTPPKDPALPRCKSATPEPKRPETDSDRNDSPQPVAQEESEPPVKPAEPPKAEDKPPGVAPGSRDNMERPHGGQYGVGTHPAWLKHHQGPNDKGDAAMSACSVGVPRLQGHLHSLRTSPARRRDPAATENDDSGAGIVVAAGTPARADNSFDVEPDTPAPPRPSPAELEAERVKAELRLIPPTPYQRPALFKDQSPPGPSLRSLLPEEKKPFKPTSNHPQWLDIKRLPVPRAVSAPRSRSHTSHRSVSATSNQTRNSVNVVRVDSVPLERRGSGGSSSPRLSHDTSPVLRPDPTAIRSGTPQPQRQTAGTQTPRPRLGASSTSASPRRLVMIDGPTTARQVVVHSSSSPPNVLSKILQESPLFSRGRAPPEQQSRRENGTSGIVQMPPRLKR